MRRSRHTVALAILALIAVGCASPSASPNVLPSAATATPSPSPSGDAAAAELLAAAIATLDEGTARVEQTIEFEGSTVIPDGTSATARGQGSFDEPIQLRLEADFSELGIGKLVMIRDDTLVYMRGEVATQLVGRGNWLLVDLESTDPAAAPFKSLASGQNDVSMALYYLYGISGDVGASDGESIDGQPTVRFEMEIDLEAARDTIPEERMEALEDLIAGLRTGGIDRSLDAEVWVGADGFVRRVHYDYHLGTGQGGGSLITVIDFSDFGEPIELDIPSEEDVVSVEDAVPQ
jgi:hypothetical protein